MVAAHRLSDTGLYADPGDCDEAGNCRKYCFTGQQCSLVNQLQNSTEYCCCPSLYQLAKWLFAIGTACNFNYEGIDGCKGFEYCGRSTPCTDSWLLVAKLLETDRLPTRGLRVEAS